MKSKYITHILSVICFKNETFLFEHDILSNILFMCCMGFTGLNFILKRSYFRKLSSIVTKEKTHNRLKSNESVANISNSSSKMSDYTGLENYVSSEKKSKKQQPNYFVAVQVTNDQIHSSVKLVQDHILQQNDQLTKSMITRSTLHITLMVLHIKDTDEHSKAIKALSTVHQEYNSKISKEPIKLEFCGISHFQNRVLYAKLKKNESYSVLCNLAKRVCVNFEMVGLCSTDRRKAFTPHLTIAKLDFSKKSLKKIKKFNTSWYQDFTDLYFGCETIRSIQLLKMHGPKTPLGYYSGDELFFCSNDKIVWKKLSSSLAIADKKKEIRSKISEITKKLLK